MQTPTPRGLPARTYLPIVAVFAVILVVCVGYLVAKGFGVTGSLFGASGTGAASASQPAQTNVEGGAPPAAVMEQLTTLRKEIAAHPKDDVALTQLGDMYETVGKFTDAIPYYKRALAANPGNVAAKAGLAEATSGLASQGSQ